MNTYADHYINHADIPETRTRKRRWREFLAESDFQEVLNMESAKHQAICKLVKTKTEGNLDHVTFLELGHMAVVLTETYRSHLEDFDCDDLHVIEVPTNIAPYCGYWAETPGVEPRTKSFLITSNTKPLSSTEPALVFMLFSHLWEWHGTSKRRANRGTANIIEPR